MEDPQHEARRPGDAPDTGPGTGPDTGPDTRPDAGATAPRQDPLRGSRTSGAWTGIVVAAILLVLLIIFIAQNTASVQIAFLGWEGSASLAVALLIATVAGIAMTALVGSLRILQLRRRVRRDRR